MTTQNNKIANWRRIAQWTGIAVLVAFGGCKAPGSGPAPAVSHAKAKQPTVRYVRCLYNHRPWLNLDDTGDRDPEGIHYRVFLDPGTGKCVHVDGTFHIEMYGIERTPDKKVKRMLICDWHYPTSAVPVIAKPGMLGHGYHLHLRWASKDTAGREIQIITRFEDVNGNLASSGTKRFRVPKYNS